MAKILILGGGIIGTMAAAFLAESGHKVEIIDRSGIMEETSSGNAAALAFGAVVPLASKGIWRKIPKWIIDPLGPFSIRPSHLPRLAPWLMRFCCASRKRARLHALEVQVGLMKLAKAEMMALIERASLHSMLITKGSLELYESEAEFRAEQEIWQLCHDYGVLSQPVRGREELAQIQPGLSERFIGGTYVPVQRNVADPQLFGKAVWDYAARLGASWRKGVVEQVRATEIELACGEIIKADKIIIAAGSWSHQFTRLFGDKVPLDTERGYNTTLPLGSFDLKLPLTFSGHGFVITPLSTGIRVGGAVELGGLKLPPNYARSEMMLKKAKMFLPDLKTEGGRQWMGYRPSLPDSLPVIGKASRQDSVFYAFGHGHLGLTQSAATARLLLDLVEGKSPSIPLEPFRAQRF